MNGKERGRGGKISSCWISNSRVFPNGLLVFTAFKTTWKMQEKNVEFQTIINVLTNKGHVFGKQNSFVLILRILFFLNLQSTFFCWAGFYLGGWRGKKSWSIMTTHKSSKLKNRRDKPISELVLPAKIGWEKR